MKPWKPFSLVVPPKGGIGSGSRLRAIKHVTHTSSALRIIEDGRIMRGLIYDESALNAYRTTVTWLSPNHWHWGSRYGNVEFSFDFDEIVAGRHLYWVESMAYQPPACRILITDNDVSGLPVVSYDPDDVKGPLRRIGGEWWWNSEITLEVMLDADLDLAHCRKLQFIKHHPYMCALGWTTCGDLGEGGSRAGAMVVSGILARGLKVVDHLLVNSKATDVSDAMDTGLSYIPAMLGITEGKLKGPLTKKKTVEAVVRAALLQLSMGDQEAAKNTVTSVAKADLVIEAIRRICMAHLGIQPTILAAAA